MSVHAVTSSASHRRIRRAQRWLEIRAAAEEVLIVGATLDAANELAREVAKKKGAAFGWHRLTLPQSAFAISAPILAARGLTPLSRIGAGALVARLVHRMNAEGRLRHYQSVVMTPGFPRAVAGVIAELRLARISRDAIAACAPDLEPLTEAYEAELKEAGLTDWPGVLALASEAASAVKGNKPRLIGLPMLLLDVPIGNDAELIFVDSLAVAATDVLATVPTADQTTLRRLRDRLRAQIDDLDQGSVGDQRTASSTSASALTNLQHRLFKEEEKSETTPDNTVEVFSAPGEGRECVEIARRVLSIARSGVALDRIAVLLRSPEGYRTYLEESFNRAGFPAHFARGAVRPDPAGRALCALLKCAADGLSARRFAEYLSLGQVPDAASDGAPPEAIPGSERWVSPDSEFAQSSTEEAAEELQPTQPAEDQADQAPVREGQLRAPRRWEPLLVDAAVIGGRDRWRRRIEGLVNDLRLRLSELAKEEETQAAVLARTLEDLAAFAVYAIPLIDLLDSLPKSANWGDWLEKLSALATRALKYPSRVLSVLSELAPMGSVGPVALNEVLLVLEPLLLQVAVPPASQRYGKVFVALIDAARGMSFDAVFVPGLAEKMFPRKIVEEPILLDAVREQIGDLATNPTRLQAERLALALAAGAAEHRICFSYSRLDLDQGRPRVPSFYGLEAFRAAEGLLPDFAELARRAETATNARLGWPAPNDPANAIDDAEYDLALLNRLEERG
jgi:ATP-dependent helicase/nuclease subunit B